MKKKSYLLIIALILAIIMSITSNSTVFASSYPYLDTSNVGKFDDFNMEQTSIDSNKSSQANSMLSSRTNVKYRISLQNDEKIMVVGEKLVFSGVEDGYIHFEEQIKSSVSGKYLVIKTDASEPEKIELSFDKQNYISTNDMYVTNDIPLIGEDITTYSEPDTGYYYMVIDIVRSGLSQTTSTDIISIKYSGTSSMSIDEILLCNELKSKDYISKKITRTFTVTDATSDYAFASFNEEYTNTKYNTLSITVTKHEDNLDLSGLVMVVGGKNYYAQTDDLSSKIILKNGDFDFTEDYSKTLQIDLEQMGIIGGGIFEFFIDSNLSGKFDVRNITFAYVTDNDIIYTPKQSLEDLVVVSFTGQGTIIDADVEFSDSYNTLALDIIGDIDYSLLSFDFVGITDIYLVTGELLSQVTSNNSKTILVDLERTGLMGYSGIFNVSYNGEASDVSILNATLGKTETIYSNIESTFEEYEKVDTTPPVVKINNEPDIVITEDTYSLTIDFNPDYNIDNDVVSVKIALTDSNNRTVYGDEANNVFSVKEGKYLLTITSTDISGNVGTESMYINIIRENSGSDDNNNGENNNDNENNNSGEQGNQQNENDNENNNTENNNEGNNTNEVENNNQGNNNENNDNPENLFTPEKKSSGTLKIILIVLGGVVGLAGLVVLSIFGIKKLKFLSTNKISFK